MRTVDLRPDYPVIYRDVEDGRDLNHLLDLLVSSRHVCFDLETMSDRRSKSGKAEAGEDWHPHSRLVSASFTVAEGESYVVPLSHPAGTERWDGKWRGVARALARAMSDALLIGHNLKYDVRWMHSMTGVDLNDRAWFDTMEAVHIIDENAPKALKVVAPHVFGVEGWKDVDLGRSEAEPWPDLARYNALDTAYTWALTWPLKESLEAQPALARLYGLLMRPVSRALTRMERTGLQTDREALRARLAELEEEIPRREWDMWDRHVPDALKDKWMDTTVRAWDKGDGLQVAVPDLLPTWSPQGKFFGEVMEALGVPIIETSEKTGAPSWAEGVIKRLALEGDWPLLKDHLEYRRLVKERDAFVQPWLAMMDGEGRLFPTFLPANVTTGRLSARSPNPQQINKGHKKFFPAPAAPAATEKWWVAQADYAQIELRVVAEIGNVESMLTAFREGKDLHRIMAGKIAGKPPGRVTADERYVAKPVNFGFLYGMGADRFKDYAFEEYGVAFTFEESARVRRLFFDTWPELEAYHERQRRLADAHGYVRSPIGRRRNLPDIHSRSPFKRSQAERQAINAPVQSYASDLMLLSILGIEERIDPSWARLVLTVHDSVVAYVKSGHVGRFVREASAVMLNPPVRRLFGAPDLRVPLEVEFEIGPRWGEAEYVVQRRSA